jgi:hypothetical protein
MDQKRSPAAGGTAEPGIGGSRQTKGSATPRKWQRVLRAFVDGRTLSRFEAVRELRDWCLNTTVSQLEQRGITILRRDETVPGACGPVHCCRYWLAPESIQCAHGLLTRPDARLAVQRCAELAA